MNHGRCEKCWWYYQVHGNGFRVEKSQLIKTAGTGVCYMHSCTGLSYLGMFKVQADSYCPDYFNRKRKKETLDQWIDRMGIQRPNIEEFENLKCS